MLSGTAEESRARPLGMQSRKARIWRILTVAPTAAFSPFPPVQGAHAMMGERRVMQEGLFYGFSLERHVPSDHLLRKIDRFVDLSEVRAHLEPYYSEVGRPSIDPELMIRMLIVGYRFGVRSERRLCEQRSTHRPKPPLLEEVIGAMSSLEVVQRGFVTVPWIDQQMAIHARREGDAIGMIMAYWSHTGWCQYVWARAG